MSLMETQAHVREGNMLTQHFTSFIFGYSEDTDEVFHAQYHVLQVSLWRRSIRSISFQHRTVTGFLYTECADA